MQLAFILILAASLSGAPASFMESFRAGLIALQNGELAAAESNLQTALKLNPESGGAWMALAQTYWKLKQPDKAEPAALKASVLGAKDSAVLQSLVIYYSESNQVLRAAGAQADLAAVTPTDRSASVRAAALYFKAAQPSLQAGDFAGAIAVLEGATSRVGKEAQLQLALGVSYYGLRRFEDAAQALLSSIALAPDSEQPYLFLGQMLDQIPARLPEVTKRFIAFEAANPANYAGYLLHAKALNAQNEEPEAARKLLEKAIAMDGSDASAYFELGSLLERMHLLSDSASALQHAATLQPSNAATHYRLSRIYDRLGKPQDAALEREKHRKLIVAQEAGR